MKKIAMLLTVCLLALGLTAYAEAAPQPEAENVEIWRGTVATVRADGVVLKGIELNPEDAALPETAENDAALTDEEQPKDEQPGEAPEAGTTLKGGPKGEKGEKGQKKDDAQGERKHGKKGESSAEQKDAPWERGEKLPDQLPADPSAKPEENSGEATAPVETLTLSFTEETQFFTLTVDETGEKAFTEATAADIAVGDTLTVRLEDGAVTTVVIEKPAGVQEEPGA